MSLIAAAHKVERHATLLIPHASLSAGCVLAEEVAHCELCTAKYWGPQASACE